MKPLWDTATARHVLGLQEYLPQSLKHQLMCLRRRSHWKRAGVIFVHIPKAAGTSVAHALYGRSTGHISASEIRRFCPDLFGQLPSFAISRNPWDRLVSAFSFVRQGGTRDAGVWKANQYQAPAFRSFEAFVEEWLVNQDLETVDYVFRKQAPYVTDEAGKVLVDFLGAVERMDGVERFLRQELGLAVSIPAKNPSRRRKSYREYYSSSRLINLVADTYSDDLSLFPYEF